jgi:hypothetical protein
MYKASVINKTFSSQQILIICVFPCTYVAIETDVCPYITSISSQYGCFFIINITFSWKEILFMCVLPHVSISIVTDVCHNIDL